MAKQKNTNYNENNKATSSMQKTSNAPEQTRSKNNATKNTSYNSEN